MATIKKRGDAYRIRVYVGTGAEGKQIIKSMTYTPKETSPTRIKKEVEKVALEFENRIMTGNYIEGDKIKFQDYVPIWREQWAKNKISLHTLEGYDAMLKNRVLPAVGFLPIGAIRPTHIRQIMTDMEKEGKSVRTIKEMLTTVNSVLRYAFDMEVIETNPVDRVHPPKQVKTEKLHFFTPEQVNIFFDALEREYTKTMKAHEADRDGECIQISEYTQSFSIAFQWRVYFNLAIYGAFRRGELCAIRWSDIDWNNRTLSIRRAFTKTRSQGQIIKTPKTESGIRTVTLPAGSMELLRQWYKEQKRLSLALGTLWEGHSGRDYDENYVFIQLDSGKEICVDTPTKRFQKVIKMYNATCEREEDKLPVIRLHDLRHTSATLLIGNGADISTVSHRLGHSKTSVTLDVYSHWLPQNDREASDTLERIINKA